MAQAANPREEITVDSSVLFAHSHQVADRYLNDKLVETDTETVDQLIARVLRRAHLRANAHNEPNEARAILHVAHSFADELASADQRFDRLQFIHAATDDQS
jgi:hypothetical protein